MHSQVVFVWRQCLAWMAHLRHNAYQAACAAIDSAFVR
jgi:hypothetical protein